MQSSLPKKYKHAFLTIRSKIKTKHDLWYPWHQKESHLHINYWWAERIAASCLILGLFLICGQMLHFLPEAYNLLLKDCTPYFLPFLLPVLRKIPWKGHYLTTGYPLWRKQRGTPKLHGCKRKNLPLSKEFSLKCWWGMENKTLGCLLGINKRLRVKSKANQSKNWKRPKILPKTAMLLANYFSFSLRVVIGNHF